MLFDNLISKISSLCVGFSASHVSPQKRSQIRSIEAFWQFILHFWMNEWMNDLLDEKRTSNWTRRSQDRTLTRARQLYSHFTYCSSLIKRCSCLCISWSSSPVRMHRPPHFSWNIYQVPKLAIQSFCSISSPLRIVLYNSCLWYNRWITVIVLIGEPNDVVQIPP